jgi:4-hydroxymandelate oxidase
MEGSHNDGAARLPWTVDDYGARARETVPAAIFDAMFGTEHDGVGRTDAANRAAFAAFGFRPRVLVDVSECSLATSVLNDRVELPVLLAPIGVASLVHADAELSAARAAGAAGTVTIVSVGSKRPAAEVLAATAGPVWFQMYLFKSRDANQRLVEYAEEIGCTAIVVTVDYPGVAAAADDGLNDGRWRGTLEALGLPEAKTPLLFNVDPKSNWRDIEWLRSLTSLPIVVKGIQTGEDAVLCREHGAAAVVLSNHGGQALPDSVGTLPRLSEVVEAARGLEVYLDGGVREGADVLKALALGARAVLIGRAQQWGLAVGGEQGLIGVLEVLRRELAAAMMFCGLSDVAGVHSRVVSPRVRSVAPGELGG